MKQYVADAIDASDLESIKEKKHEE